jgi:hypothetical protein
MKAVQLRCFFLCLPSEAGKPVRLEDSGVTLTKGKIIRMARASLANGGTEGNHRKLEVHN